MQDDVLSKITKATNKFNPQPHKISTDLRQVIRLLCSRNTAPFDDIKQDQGRKE